MTIHPPDETLSALLDREPVDVLDAAHVEECAVCRERIDALRHVVTALAEPVVAPARVRDAAVAAALVENSGAAAVVRRMAMARRARAKEAAVSGRRANALLVAAAVVVALGVGGWLLSQTGGVADRASTNTNSLAVGQDRTLSGNPTPTTFVGADLGSLGVDNQAAAGGATAASGSAFYNAGDIGDYSDTAPIVDRYHQFLAGSPPEEGSYMVNSPCPSPEDRSVVWHAELTYNGVEAYARILFKSRSDQILEVLNRSNCALVESQAI
jgi:hypothetical protein